MSYLVLIVSVLAYATGIVAQSHAARRTEQRTGADPGLLVRLASQKVYLLGFGAQVVGFGLAFLARADLPLFLVQAASTSAAGVATLIGVLVLGWRLRPIELGVLAVLAVGLVMLVAAAKPSASSELPLPVALLLIGVLVLVVVAAIPVGRLTGPVGSVAHGVLAGAAFAVLAIASRPLAAGPLLEIPLKPLFYLVVAAALIGQTLFATALQRGSAPAAAASMDAVTVVVSSIVGLAVLGDQIVAGQGVFVAVGLVLVVLAVLGFGVFGGQHGAKGAVPDTEVADAVVDAVTGADPTDATDATDSGPVVPDQSRTGAVDRPADHADTDADTRGGARRR